jgi:transposase-like protein
MSQHFLLSAKARTLSLASVMRMTDEEAETVFRAVRWTDGKAICPHCGCPTVYECRRPSGALRFRCKACRKDFSITSGTLFAFHKMPLRQYLAAIAIFVNEVKGKAALAMSRDLDVQYKTAFVLSHKMREAMAFELKGMHVGGEGETVEIDGMYVGGYIKPANHKENRRDRRLAKNQNGKRQVVVVIRERGGRTLPAVFTSESAALSFIVNRVAPETRIIADEASSWNVSTWSGLTIASCIATAQGSTATARKSSSPGCAGPRSGITTTSPVRIWSGMPRKAHGARIIAASPTASRSRPWPRWR